MSDLKNHISAFLLNFKNGVHALSESQKALVTSAILAFSEFMSRDRVREVPPEVTAAAEAKAKADCDPHPVEYVRQFHQTFKHPITPVPTIPDAPLRLLRVRLTGEEFMEFASASGFPLKIFVELPDGDMVPLMDAKPEDETRELIDIVEAADAHGDINVTNNGSALVWGIPIAAVDRAIHASNMSKLGEDGQPIYDEHGKVQKGPNYREPDIAQVLADHGWPVQ